MMLQYGCRVLLPVAAAVTALAFSGQAAAQAANYPSKAIRIIVPFAPGGPNDILGRIVGQQLNELWGRPAVIENCGGAGGTIGGDAGAKSAPAGYPIVMGGSRNMG